MKYQNLHIQTQRDFPSNMRTQGFGYPVRVTVGEKALQNGMVELKKRKDINNQLIPTDEIIQHLQ